MSFDLGFNFRDTTAFVTDPADTVAVVAIGGFVPVYPETYGSTDGGWDTSVTLQMRDRNSGNDARIAGHNRADGTDVWKFRVDLPASGEYEISTAMGDANYACPDLYWRILDNTTELASFHSSTSTANNYRDATDAEYSAANWPGSNTAVQYTFATTTFFIEIGNAAGTGSSPLAHLRIVQLASEGSYVAANQNEIVVFGGDGTPKDIVLRPLPLKPVVSTTIYLRDVDATPQDVVLYDPTVAPEAGGARTATLSKTQDGQTLTAATAVAIVADATLTQAGNTLTGATAVAVVADLSNAQASQTLAGAAVVDVVADLSQTQAGQTLTADSTVDAARTADLDLAQAGNSVAATSVASQPSVPSAGGGATLIPFKRVHAARLVAVQDSQGVSATASSVVGVAVAITQSGDSLSSNVVVFDVRATEFAAAQRDQVARSESVSDWRDVIADDDELMLQVANL